MRYRLTCLTPMLVGDGSHLSPIDYMVWKDQVNVLDQARIFRLLAKGPRLENYLKQISRADKLDFASWGGFAQNFAGRRIPFENAASARYWQALPSEYLRIPNFASSHRGPFLPGSAIKGALRTALLAERVSDPAMKALAETVSKDRVPRNLAQQLEDRLIGSGGSSRIKPIGVSDSDPVSRDAMKIFMMRVATLAPGGPGKLTLRWKQAPHGSVDGNRPAAGALSFAEMAAPGSVFEGRWRENPYYQDQAVAKALRWKTVLSTSKLMESANANAGKMLSSHRRYAEVAELDRVRDDLIRLETVLDEARAKNSSCLVCLGWGGGFLSKSGGPSPSSDSYRQILRQLHYYSKAIASGLPFPKTRQIVFLNDQPATLPGWALLEVS